MIFLDQFNSTLLDSAWLSSAYPGLTWLSTAIGSILALKFKRSPFCSNTFEFLLYIIGKFFRRLMKMHKFYVVKIRTGIFCHVCCWGMVLLNKKFFKDVEGWLKNRCCKKPLLKLRTHTQFDFGYLKTQFLSN